MEKAIEDNGVYEVLLVNKDGLITEGSRSNIYFIKYDSFYCTNSYGFEWSYSYQCKIRLYET